VLVTDGLDENSVLNLEDALAVAESSKIPVFAVGVGHAQERTLRRIAKLTAGSYLPGSSATGEEIASAIQNSILPARAGASVATPAPREPPAPAPPQKEPQTAPRGRGLALVGMGLLVLVALLFVFGRKRKPRCETCGRELPGPFSPCPFCAEGATPSFEPSPLPETILKKLDGTEEFLEKTVTLRESPVLSITKGAGAGLTYSLNADSATSLGRAKVNDIVVPDVAVSTQHCRIKREDGRFVVLDLRSRNGTFVNDRRVSRCALSEGDTIKIGETFLQFRTDQRRT
jgi:hypothetical protein